MTNRLGKTIRILRQAKAMKLSDVAKASRISVPFLSLVENGERQPSLEVLRRISDSLRVPSEALLVMGMGDETNLVTNDTDAAELSDAVGQLMEIENKLRRLLNKEASGATKRRPARTYRGSDGAKPR